MFLDITQEIILQDIFQSLFEINNIENNNSFIDLNKNIAYKALLSFNANRIINLFGTNNNVEKNSIYFKLNEKGRKIIKNNKFLSLVKETRDKFFVHIDEDKKIDSTICKLKKESKGIIEQEFTEIMNLLTILPNYIGSKNE